MLQLYKILINGCVIKINKMISIKLLVILVLIVSANRLAMCTCTIIAVLIYHDVIIQILPSISMCLDTHIGLIRSHFFNILYYFHVICSV